ncbi:butyrate kinase [Marinifilum caeruleilacunae]|uniref:Probable butyrate kinase n=1 Tax=Marinifilum caeruleilacunae TaxID=2499076 RepID=A0ABX1WSJ4_9BACT|nr:butyrate kinase [Marinifilum caeruleilacunae]NOU59042.1 butyrate kinase [Marinifilum caeruleilacunae]
METRRILAINPGSTSTKIAVFQGDKSVFLKNIKHSAEELAEFNQITEQFEFRKNIIMKEMVDAEIQIDLIEAVVGRGGLVKPIESGIYEVNDRLKEDLRVGILGEHASNLGGLIADNIAQSLPKAKAYIADPVVVDEMIDVARVSGHPEFQRVSIFHALNQKAIGRAFAQSIDKKYEDINVIVAHLGGGISVGAHLKGKVVDVNNALDGEGPFSPERSGTLPTGALAKMCFSGEYTLDDIKKMIKGEGGLVAHLGTNDAYEVELKAKDGDAKAKLIQDAMSYQVAKSIGEMAAVLKGDVEGILLTGGIAHNPDLVNYIKDMVSFIAPVVVYPGEDEMKALAMNGYMVLRNEIEPKVYE